jgi:acyl-homoserine-lactone acylase
MRYKLAIAICIATDLLLRHGYGYPNRPAGDPFAQKVTIYRDNYGVPHIVGEDEPAVFFGYGYAQAQDHLDDMMLQYLDAQGRLAEVKGPSALGNGELRFIPYEFRWGGDYLQRLLHSKEAVVDHMSHIDPETYCVLDGFARGVNEYIREHRETIAKWIEPITAADVEALERSQYLRFYSISDALNKTSGTIRSFPTFGSNQWALAKDRTVDGHIIHVEHTHMPWANRFQNYEAHLMVPGKIDAAGISWFGSPVFLMGWNDKITWSGTWNQPNIADVYEERVNPENTTQYLYEGKWRTMRMERQSFRVKEPSGYKNVTLLCYYTHHGPVVHYDRKRNRAYSVRLPNFDGVNYATGLYSIMRSRNLAEFKDALSRQLIPRWNFLFSDPENIFWVHNGVVARRDPGFNWSRPVPGWLADTEWKGNLPFNANPQLLNPSSGFLQNCNNPPWVVTRNSGLMPLAPAPYYLQVKPKSNAGEEALNARGERLFQVLANTQKFTLEQMFALAYDTHVMASDVIIPLFDKLADSSLPKTPAVKHAIELIRRWDGASRKESIAYTYVHYWALSYEKVYSERSFSRFLSYSRKDLVDVDSSREQTRTLHALEDAIHSIESKFHRLDVPWDQVNFVYRDGAFPLEGESLFNVLHPDGGDERPDGTIDCNDGWGHLMIVEETVPKRVWTLLPYGESQHRGDPHFNDQARMHSEQRVKPFWFYAKEIAAHTEAVWGDPERLQNTAGIP